MLATSDKRCDEKGREVVTKEVLEGRRGRLTAQATALSTGTRLIHRSGIPGVPQSLA